MEHDRRGDFIIDLIERGELDSALKQGFTQLRKGTRGEELTKILEAIPVAGLASAWAKALPEKVPYSVGALYFFWMGSTIDVNEARLILLRAHEFVFKGKGSTCIQKPKIAGEDYEAEDDPNHKGDLVVDIRLDDELGDGQISSGPFASEDGIPGTLGYLYSHNAGLSSDDDQYWLFSRMGQALFIDAARQAAARIRDSKCLKRQSRDLSLVVKTWQIGPCVF